MSNATAIDFSQDREAYCAWLAAHPAARDFRHHRHVIALHDWLIESVADVAITYLEFGVYCGRSLRWWLKGNPHPDSRFVGFDAFRGLPEPWQSPEGYREMGHFTCQGEVPCISDHRLEFEVGWFTETIPPFCASFVPRGRLIVHVDCDLYSSASVVFECLRPHLVPGSIVIMDEAGTGDEYRAFVEAAISAVPIAHAGCAVAAVVNEVP